MVVLIFLAVSLGLVLWIKFGSRPGDTGGLQPGSPIPPIQALGWVNGEAPTPDELQGKVLVVDAWATWCLPCRLKAPELVKVYKQFKDRGVVFIGLTGEGPEAVPGIEEFLEDTGIEWRNGYGAGGTLNAFGADYIPSMWIVGPDGIVRWNYASREPIEKALERALASAKKS